MARRGSQYTQKSVESLNPKRLLGTFRGPCGWPLWGGLGLEGYQGRFKNSGNRD